ncbi:MAG: hypothetical protein DWQ08_11100 [Proteobacteria bacterium]|nr:MAG: hypothetical protein DWQ08_11100 [Pseudomonadota bacterium]
MRQPAADIMKRIRSGASREALEQARLALRSTPRDPELLGVAGLARLELGDEATGLCLLEAAYNQQPDNLEWLSALCRHNAIRFDRHRPMPRRDDTGAIRWPAWVEDAADDFTRWVACAPLDNNALVMAGRFHKALGNTRRAAELGVRAAERNTADPEAAKLAAESLENLRRFDEAEHYYERASTLAPDDPIVPWLRAMRQLASGRFDRGWRGYDKRRSAFGWRTASYPFEYPNWRGEDLSGKSILVHGEQGFGDEIMFSSILPEIIAEAGQVVVAASPALAKLFARSFPDADIRPFDRSPETVKSWQEDQPPPPWCADYDFDFQSPVGSLARWRRPDRRSFPGNPYLVPDAARAAAFASRLSALEKDRARPLRIGLNLTANLATGLMGLEKTIPRASFEPALRSLAKSSHFVSLHPSRDALASCSGEVSFPTDFSSELKDFDDTAALVATLDMVVTVDTAVAHLAGAMGKPTLILLKYNADWRYLDKGDRCIWYDSVRLVRQTRRNDWSDVVTRAADLLADMVSARELP